MKWWKNYVLLKRMRWSKMSKEKKTIEELVGETIVPVEEQPYELPEN